MKYYSSNAVTKLLGVTAQTLRNWDKDIVIIQKTQFYLIRKSVKQKKIFT